MIIGVGFKIYTIKIPKANDISNGKNLIFLSKFMARLL